MRPRVSILAATCTIHTLARPRLLAQLLAKDYEVQVVAPVFDGDDDVYARTSWPGSYVPVRVGRWPAFARSIAHILDAVSGDVVYACKTRATSLGVALLGRLRDKRPVVVDVDDRDIYQCYPYSRHVAKNLALSVSRWRDPNSYPFTLGMDCLATRADHVTSVSSHFQRVFGGTVVPQAVDTEVFDPARYDRQDLRRQWHLDAFRIVLFLGRPQPHKGLDDIVQAVERSRHTNARLVVVGGYTAYADQLQRHERVVFLGPQSFERSPEFLAMADVVMVPQRVGPVSVGQMPTKIPEAMAMQVPVIATDISDISQQVGEGGFIVSCGDVQSLTEALDRLLDDPVLQVRTGHAARARVIQHYSLTAVRPTLREVFQKYVKD